MTLPGIRHLVATALSIVFVTALTCEQAFAQAIPRNQSCVDCHIGLDEVLAAPARDFANDIHAERGFGCLDCHGSRAHDDTARNPSSGFLSVPTRRNVASMCGSCHSDAAFMRNYNPSLRVDQVAEYATSQHGRLLADRNDPNVAVCASCHSAHAIRPSSDVESSVHPLNVANTCANCHADADFMQPYDIPTNQHSDYEQSVHWTWMFEEGDLSAPTCNDCHGNHGAAPPGFASVGNVCGQCHSVMADLFTASRHDEYFEAEGLPGCATCHNNHDIKSPNDEMLTELQDGVCTDCHDDNYDFPMMKSLVDSLLNARAQSEAKLAEAVNLGMEVSQAQFTLEEVTTALIKARSAVHSFAADSVRKEVEVGLAIVATAGERGQAALDEHLFRRQGLAISVTLILVFIIGLAMKIRQLERTRR